MSIVAPLPPYKILFLTHVLPYPLVGGAKTRAYYMLRQLSKSHQVTLISFVRDSDLPVHIEHLKLFCKAVHTVPMKRAISQDVIALIRGEFTGKPAIIVRDEQQEMCQLLAEVVRGVRFDFVHADQTAMAQYALFSRACFKERERPFILLDQHNALYRVFQRQAEYEPFWSRIVWRRESKRLAKYERNLLRQFDHLLTVSDEDKQAMLTLADDNEKSLLAKKITIIPICVDPSHRQVIEKNNKRQQIIHLGTMFWPPNRDGVLWFAREVLPLVAKQLPTVEFVIVGANPSKDIKRLEQSVPRLAGRIRVTDFLDDPRDELSQSQVFVVPLHAGGGMRVKILDAWLWGLPIVTTSIGAEGIEYTAGENILVADSAITFAEAILKVFNEPDLDTRLRKYGRQWVEERYDWQNIYPEVEKIYSELPY